MAISGFLFDGREVLQSLDYDGKNHVIYSAGPSFFRVRIDNAITRSVARLISAKQILRDGDTLKAI